MSEFEQMIFNKLAIIENKLDRIIHSQTNPSVPFEIQQMENFKNRNKIPQGYYKVGD